VTFGSTRDSAYVFVCRCMLYRSKMSACYSYSLHGRIAMLHLFCCVFTLEFLFNPQFDLEPDYITRSQSFADFNDTFWVGKYCELFTHESIIDQYAISALYSPPNCPVPFRRSPPKSNTPTPSPTPLTTPNGIPIQSPVSPLLTAVDRQMARTNVRSHEQSAQLF